MEVCAATCSGVIESFNPWPHAQQVDSAGLRFGLAHQNRLKWQLPDDGYQDTLGIRSCYSEGVKGSIQQLGSAGFRLKIYRFGAANLPPLRRQATLRALRGRRAGNPKLDLPPFQEDLVIRVTKY